MLVMEKPLESNLKGSCTCDKLTISQWNSTEYKWQNKMQLCKTGRKGTQKKVNRIIWFWVGGFAISLSRIRNHFVQKMLCFLILLCSIWTCLPIIFLIFREAEERECDLRLTITSTVVGFQEEVGEKKDRGQGGTLRTWCSESPVPFCISRAEKRALGASFPVRASCCRPALQRWFWLVRACVLISRPYWTLLWKD